MLSFVVLCESAEIMLQSFLVDKASLHSQQKNIASVMRGDTILIILCAVKCFSFGHLLDVVRNLLVNLNELCSYTRVG